MALKRPFQPASSSYMVPQAGLMTPQATGGNTVQPNHGGVGGGTVYADTRLPRISAVAAGLVTLAPATGDTTARVSFINSDEQLTFTSGSFNPAIVGSGGLDSGAERVSTWYYIYLVRVSSVIQVRGSENPPYGTTNVGPIGFSSWVYVGAVRNNSSGNFVDVEQHRFNEFHYEIRQAFTLAGTPATEDASPVLGALAAFVPATSVAVYMQAQYQVDAGDDGTWYFWVDGQQDGGASTAKFAKLQNTSGNFAELTQPQSFWLQTPNTTKQFYYQRSSTDIFVSELYISGYNDGYIGARV